jgi:hypothetical protein
MKIIDVHTDNAESCVGCIGEGNNSDEKNCDALCLKYNGDPKYNCGDHSTIFKEEKEVKLDFSGISTEELRYAIEGYRKGENLPCRGIMCLDNRCPFSNSVTGNGHCKSRRDAELHYELFKEELNRREKDMNEMPTLEAGMIVELDNNDTGYLGRYLYINDGWMIKDLHSWMNLEDSETIITKVFSVYIKSNSGCNYNTIGDENNHKLIWSRKSDNDIKIEQLQKKFESMETEYNNGMKSVVKISDDMASIKRDMENLKA